MKLRIISRTEKPKNVEFTKTNKTIRDLATFQLKLDKV